MLKASWRRTDLETPTGETMGWGTLEATEIYKEAGQGAKRMLLRGSCDHWLGWGPHAKGLTGRSSVRGIPAGPARPPASQSLPRGHQKAGPGLGKMKWLQVARDSPPRSIAWHQRGGTKGPILIFFLGLHMPKEKYHPTLLSLRKYSLEP